MAIKSEINESWKKKSWINDLAENVALAKDLTEVYANDVLEAVGGDYFSTLDAAISDLRTRTGLNEKEVSEIKRIAVAMVQGSYKTTEANKSDLVCDECGKIANFCPCDKKERGDHDEQEAEMKKDDLELSDEASEKSEVTSASFDKVEIVRAAKSGKLDVIKATLKNNEDAVAYIEKVEAWFQGSDESTVEGDKNTSNNPEKLGYPGEVSYNNQGTDPRMKEQKAFEGAAADTKKVMGPSGEELKLKETMQRAERIERLKKVLAKSKCMPKSKMKKSKNKMDKKKVTVKKTKKKSKK